MAGGRRLTAAQARDRRSKRAAIGLGAVLLLVGVIQGPKLMKQLSPPAPPAPAAAAVGATGATGDTTTAGSSTGTGTQLANFSLLSAKDPFHAQVSSTDSSPSASTSGGAAASTSATTTTPAKSKTLGAAITAAAKSAGAASTTTTTTPTVGFTMAPPNAALVKTNGHRQIVAIGAGFPSSQPLFKLVALGKKGIRIGVLGGSFTSGAPTLLLRKGHTITLANEADGTHYVLQLLRLTTVATTAQTGTTPPATTPATTTPTDTTPAATTTTPADTTTTTPAATTTTSTG